MLDWRYSVCIAGLASACRQPDRPVAVESSPDSTDRSKSVAASSRGEVSKSTLANDCIVPLAETPAPQADRAEHCPVAGERAPTLPIGQVTFNEAVGKPQVQVELARTDASRQRGLMYRTRLDSNSGMLFSWDEDAPRTFWMHDTCLPLDMLFVTQNGVIAGVVEQVPVLNDFPRGVPCPVAHVLEVNAGWVRAHGIKPGQHLTISFP